MEIVLRAALIFFFLWMVTRALGKRELAEMTAFELLLLVTVGDLVQQGVTQEDMSVTGAVLAVSTIALLVLLFSYLGFRMKRAVRVTEGEPVLVVDNGRILEGNLHLERVTADELQASARNQGIARLSDVRWGVLEPDGRFSFVRKTGGDGEQSVSRAARRRAE
jgi:uncharacterized membrane protein YcaP (DUF421 family)